MSRIVLVGTLLAVLMSAIGCSSDSYSADTKNMLKKMAELELALKKVDDSHPDGGTAIALMNEISQLHAEREQAPPHDPQKRAKIRVLYGQPFISVLNGIREERSRIAAIPKVTGVTEPLDTLLTNFSREEQMILADARFQSLRPTKSGGGGGGPGGGFGGSGGGPPGGPPGGPGGPGPIGTGGTGP